MECGEILQSDGTVGALAKSAAAVLAAAGVDSARLNAEVLLALACGIDRAGLYARWRSAVAPDSRWRFDQFVARRRRREPLQYIVGDQEFWSLDFLVSPAVLIPRPETELLVELVLQTVRDTRGRVPRVCDLGTGSGCIAVALARELPEAEIWALDISEAALAVARLNARKHGVAERIRFMNSDGCSAVRRAGFEVIVCNPPYVSSGELDMAQPELAWEPRQALDGGPTGLTVIERLLAESPASLKPGGWLLMEIGADQGPATERLARAGNFTALSIRPDYAGRPRALVARR